MMPTLSDYELSQVVGALACYTEVCGADGDEYEEVKQARALMERLAERQDPIEALWRKVVFRDPLIGSGGSATPERCRSGAFMWHMPNATKRSPHRGTVFFTPQKDNRSGEYVIFAEYVDSNGDPAHDGSEIPFRLPPNPTREPFARAVDDYMMLLKGFIAGVGAK